MMRTDASRTAMRIAAALSLVLLPVIARAQGLPAITGTPGPGGGTTYSLSVQTLLLLTSLSFLPAIVLMTTSFTRIIIVFGMLRTAMGTQTSPPNQVLLGLARFLTFFIMSPVAEKVYTDAYLPMSRNEIQFDQALDRASVPMKAFMLKQVRETAVAIFANLPKTPPVEKTDALPMRVITPAFVTS